MLKFFRKIRQQLLSENRFSKYLIYAVGEIVLVVIGILIALQINTYSEHSKFREQTLNQLDLISRELDRDIMAYKQRAKNYPLRIEVFKKLSSKEYEDVNLQFAWGLLTSNVHAINFGQTYAELKSNGGLTLINNIDLIDKLNTYHDQNQPNYAGWQEYHALAQINYLEEKVMDFMEFNDDLTLNEESLTEVLQEKKLLGTIAFQVSVYEDVLSVVEENLVEAKKLKALLDKYIEQERNK